jgi:hypothetical protein
MRLIFTVLLLLVSAGVHAAIPPDNVVRVLVEEKEGIQSGGTGTLVRSDLIVTNCLK